MTPVNDNDSRIDQFRSEIEQLKLKGSSSDSERRLLLIGIVLTVVGIGLAVFGAVQVGETGDSAADQRAYMAQGSLMGLALIVAGAAVWIRFSLARYLRFWLVRMTYESRANTDRIVDAIERASGLPTSTDGAELQHSPGTVTPPAAADPAAR